MAFISKLASLRSSIPRILTLRCYSQFNNTLQRIPNGNNAQIRFKSLFPKFRANEEDFKLKDKIPDNFRLIYRNTMSNYLLVAQMVSCLSAVIVGVYVFYAESTIKHYEPNMIGWKQQPIAVENEIFVYLTAIIFVSVLLQYFIKKMPLRIYNYDDKKYVFVYYNVFPFFTKNISCQSKEIVRLPSKANPLLPWTDSRYEVKHNHGVILVDQFFKNTGEMNIMLGLQKRYVEPEEPDY